MEHKPAEIIRQARQKAEKALMEACEAEILRICEAFSYDTGLAVSMVSFNFIDVTSIGTRGKETTMNCVNITHEGI